MRLKCNESKLRAAGHTETEASVLENSAATEAIPKLLALIAVLAPKMAESACACNECQHVQDMFQQLRNRMSGRCSPERKRAPTGLTAGIVPQLVFRHQQSSFLQLESLDKAWQTTLKVDTRMTQDDSSGKISLLIGQIVLNLSVVSWPSTQSRDCCSTCRHNHRNLISCFCKSFNCLCLLKPRTKDSKEFEGRD